jgi:DHA1 family bicyclomycin/chloramphenicol resistance-like MFS transporter
MPKSSSPPHLATLVLLTAFSPLSLNMFLPSLENIAADLDADYALISTAVAGYLAVTAILQLVIGPLSDRFGRRPVMLCALAVFTIASVFCSLADHVWMFLGFRLLQGCMSAGYSLSMAIVRDTNPARKAASLIGYISMIMAIVPMAGPVLGGLLDAAFGWRASFYFYAISGAGLFVLCWFDLGETKPGGESAGKATGAVGALLGSGRFWSYASCSALSAGTFYVFLASAPRVAVVTYGVTPAELGFLIGSITAGFMTGSFLAGRLSSAHSLTTMMLAGRTVACVGLSLGILAAWLEFQSPFFFFGSTVFVGIGNGITSPSSSSGAMSIRPDLAGSAAGLIGTLTLGGGAALTTLAGYLVADAAEPMTVLLLMLACAAAGLGAALTARFLERNG